MKYIEDKNNLEEILELPEEETYFDEDEPPNKKGAVLKQKGHIPKKSTIWIGVLATIKGLWSSISKDDKVSSLDGAGSDNNDVIESLSDMGSNINKLDRDQGKIGKSWEYAVKLGIDNDNPILINRINGAISECPNFDGETDNIEAVLWGDDKPENLYEVAWSNIKFEDKLWTPGKGRPIKIKKHLGSVKRGRSVSDPDLPKNATKVWKADLFVKRNSSGKWLGVSVKWDKDNFDSKNYEGISIGVSAHQPSGYGDSAKDPYWDPKQKMSVTEIPWKWRFGDWFNRGRKCVMDTLDKIPGVEPKPEHLSGSYDISRLLYEKRNEHIYSLNHFIENKILELDIDFSNIEKHKIDTKDPHPDLQPMSELG